MCWQWLPALKAQIRIRWLRRDIHSLQRPVRLFMNTNILCSVARTTNWSVNSLVTSWSPITSDAQFSNPDNRSISLPCDFKSFSTLKPADQMWNSPCDKWNICFSNTFKNSTIIRSETLLLINVILLYESRMSATAIVVPFQSTSAHKICTKKIQLRRGIFCFILKCICVRVCSWTTEPEMQKENTESAVEASISSERSKDDKWRWEQNRGQAKSKTPEEGDRKRNLYLLTSSSDSSVSDQLSKSGHCVSRSLERSAMCIFVFITRWMENTRSQSRGRAINSAAKGNGWKKTNGGDKLVFMLGFS